MLFLEPINKTEIKKLQTYAYYILPTVRYNPPTYKIHCTININENERIIEGMFNKLRDTILELTLDKICLYEIYSAKAIKK